MFTVVDTQATTFLHQRQQHRVVMDRKMAELEPRGPSTDVRIFFRREATSKLYWNVAVASQGAPLGERLPVQKQQKPKKKKKK